MAIKVYKYFTYSLDCILAAYNPKDSPKEYKLASQITKMLDNTLLSYLKGNITPLSLPIIRAILLASGGSWASAAARTPAIKPATPSTTTPRSVLHNQTWAKKKDLQLFACLPLDSPI